jgi:hypothetical protein
MKNRHRWDEKVDPRSQMAVHLLIPLIDLAATFGPVAIGL